MQTEHVEALPLVQAPSRAAPSFARSFADVTREHGFEPLRVEGTLPQELSGTMFRNGPGLFSSHGHNYEHWFDGDGMIAAARFDGGQAQGAVRILQTPGLLEERRRGAAYFGGYGTKSPGRWNPLRALRMAREGGKNPANTSVMVWGQRTFALCEVGRPLEFDPLTLDTVGETDLGGAVERPFSAHPHRVASTGYVYNVGTRVGRPNLLDVIAMRPDGSAGRVATLPLPAPTLIHDFAVTDKHIVVFVAPLELSLAPVLLGRASFVDSLRWRPELGTEVLVIPLDAPASPIRFHVDAFWAWHVANAYERGSEIVVDLVRHPDFVGTREWLAGASKGKPRAEADGILHRAVIDPARRTLRETPLRTRTGEFPRIAPHVEAKPHRAVYVCEHSSRGAGLAGPPDTLVRADVETGAIDEHRFEAGLFPSEGVFVPHPSREDELAGWLVSLVYDANAHESHWAIFDAGHLDAGPLAKVHVGQHIPLGFHGAWLGA